MLKLKNITKDYVTGPAVVHALKGVDLEFRESEFVAILGPSGCGKTTMLNIIGGLDRYTEGDLVINGKSTKTFKDRNWDTYRNHSIGFVFQSYNLIPHQTVLANVELALTLSGVSKSERRKRAAEALSKVGLGDQLHKKPSQMSGGQMQRVAIARALVNDPDILLADEPTGALDTTTSVQIMEILKEISKDKLIIMVTHNPELAYTYATRIVKMVDGLVTDDTDPYTATEEEVAAAIEEGKEAEAQKSKNKKKTSMSFFTALSLSLNNLATKKGRTAMTSFAGSIGIIGIALILALSSGINAFITQVQEDTLSTYPLSISKESQDMSALLSTMTTTSSGEDFKSTNQIHVDNSMGSMLSAMSSTVKNDLDSFKIYLDANYDDIKDYVSDVQYTYDYDFQIYNIVPMLDDDGNVILDENGNPKTEARKVGMETIFENAGDAFSGMSELIEMSGSAGIDVFSEMINNQELLNQQYEVIAGDWPREANEVILVVNSNNQITRMTLYMLGILDPDNIQDEMAAVLGDSFGASSTPSFGTETEEEEKELFGEGPYDYDYFVGMAFKLLTNSDFYVVDDAKGTYNYNGVEYPIWKDIRDDKLNYTEETLMEYINTYGTELKISGIVRPKAGATANSISGAIGYTHALTEAILDKTSESEVINQQKASYNETDKTGVNVLTGLPFEETVYTPENIHELIDKIPESTMEYFYAYMTQQILTNPEFSDRIQVTDTNSFLGMYMLLPADKQATIFEAVLNAAKENPANAASLNMLCTVITQTTGGITVTPDNFVKLLPILDTQNQVMLAFMGLTKSEQVPFDVAGLIALAGEDAMQIIYAEMTEAVKTMTVNKEVFLTLLATLSAEDEAFIQLERTLYGMAPQIDETYESVMKKLDNQVIASPASINFYAKDFESKEKIEDFIAKYNDKVNAEYIEEYKAAHDGKAPEDKSPKVLQYSDLVGTLMSSVTTIINVISYVLIAFVGISLVVSSIMIGIITNISVLERTKEIGILRAIGASKKDVSRVFNAETVIIGFCAGTLGVLITSLLCIPVSLIIRWLTGFDNITAYVPVAAGIILIVISVLLTMIAGIIPARSAAKKDPVIALRTE